MVIAKCRLLLDGRTNLPCNGMRHLVVFPSRRLCSPLAVEIHTPVGLLPLQEEVPLPTVLQITV